MFDMTTYELLKTLYVAVSGGTLFAAGIVVWFFIHGELIHRAEDIKGGFND